MSIHALADADASCGAKAAGLARLIRAGLRVPDGFVIDGSVFRSVAAVAEVDTDRIGHALEAAAQRIAAVAIPAALDREVRARAAQLGRLAVRSSASVEDGALGSAAGVFASITDVAPDEVWQAVRAVWTSALTPLAVAYARHRGAAIAMSVIIQRFVPGTRITVYTRTLVVNHPPADDDLLLSRDGELERIARSAAGQHPEAALALAAEAAITAPHGADVELIVPPTPHDTPWIVQARPVVPVVQRPRPTPPSIVLAPLVRDGRRWTWDIAHNPDPMSSAQAGLVELVDRAACTPYALRVCAGYLYSTPRPLGDPPSPPADRAELASRIAAIEARFVLGEPVNLAEAVERYQAFMRIWACELSPLVAAARRALPDRLARDGTPPERIAGLVAEAIGRRRVLRDRVMSPAWDVSVPTFEEQPGYYEPAEPPHAPIEPATAEVELARAAADAAELDDLWFARAQWMVRRALLAHSSALRLRRGDVFWLPLDELITLRSLDPDDAHRRASAARAAHDRAAEWAMPLVIHGNDVSRELPSQSREVLRGVGFGPRVVGRVSRFTESAGRALIRRDDVVVTRAITPALAMLLHGCAALVSETGGLLDHGAALARELGITCVVGCTGAWTQLPDGAVVSVSGDAGLVELASPT